MEIIKRAIGAFGASVGVLLGFGLMLGLVETKTTNLLYSVFGWGGVVGTGIVGTPVHEFGHWLMCKIFGLHVTDVSLFRPVSGRKDGILGYVKYSYDKNSFIQRMGCFFSGIAPLIIGAVIILVVVRFLTPEVWGSIGNRVGDISGGVDPLSLVKNVIAGFFEGLISLRGTGILKGLLCLYIVCSISMHMSLSPADLNGALAGLFVILVICLIYMVQ